MPFEKGSSGNPGGRPRKSKEQVEFERKCQEWAAVFAMAKLAKAADSENVREVLAATQEILNRGFGKPVETSHVEASINSEVGSSVEDLERDLAELIGAGKGSGGGNPSAVTVDSGK